MTQSYPTTRLRRSRATSWRRAMVRETVLTPADLIWPLFITEGEAVEEPISSLPGVSRWSVDQIVVRAKEAIDLGIPCLALFPNTQTDRRSDDGASQYRLSMRMSKYTAERSTTQKFTSSWNAFLKS